jgi:hypothetical protein
MRLLAEIRSLVEAVTHFTEGECYAVVVQEEAYHIIP